MGLVRLMAINDRWYTSERQGDDSRKKVGSAEHGCRERWQVRWRDEQGRQRKKSFERKLDAQAFEAKVRKALGTAPTSTRRPVR